jgi:tRNA threonylcarbamoyladenosine biosynthesis protein TsaE
MSTEQTWQTSSTSLEDTLALAEKIGQRCQGGEVIELLSDLGGGKTTFVRGLAKGMGSIDTVSSPSFTLSNEYDAGGKRLYHFDFYRLQEAGILRDELAECIADPEGVVVIEWAAIVEDVLPIERVRIKITTTGEDSRDFSFSYPEAATHLIPTNT